MNLLENICNNLVRLGILQSQGAIPYELYLNGLKVGQEVTLHRKRRGYSVDLETRVVEASVRSDMPPGQYTVLFGGTEYVTVRFRNGDSVVDKGPDIGWYGFEKVIIGKGTVRVALFDDRGD